MIYNISVEGSDLVRKRDIIEKISKKNNGILRTSEIVEAGVSKTTLATYVKENNYERIYQGIYISPDAWEDRLYLLQLRCPKTIYSHDTALYLLNMTDQDPLQYTVTVKSGYNASHLKKDGVQVYYINPEFFDLGRMKMITPYQNYVYIYNRERTICDLVRNRSSIETQTIAKALNEYINSRDKNIHQLLAYAQKLGVTSLINRYLEVLL